MISNYSAPIEAPVWVLSSYTMNATHENIIKYIIQNLPNKTLINAIEFESKAIDEI